jgi:hypothetical protein
MFCISKIFNLYHVLPLQQFESHNHHSTTTSSRHQIPNALYGREAIDQHGPQDEIHSWHVSV